MEGTQEDAENTQSQSQSQQYEEDTYNTQEDIQGKKRKSERNNSRKSGRQKRKLQATYFQPLGEPCRIYQAGIYTPYVLEINGAVVNKHANSKEESPWATLGPSSSYGQSYFKVQAALIHTSMQQRMRAQARWYYPMDFPVRSAQMAEEAQTERERKERYKERLRELRGTEFGPSDIPDAPPAPYKPPELKSIPGCRPLVMEAQRLRLSDPFRNRDERFIGSRVLDCMDEARFTMLQDDSKDDLVLDALKQNKKKISKTKPRDLIEQQYREALLRGHRMYGDSDYLPANWKIEKPIRWLSHAADKSVSSLRPCLYARRAEASLAFAHQRQQNQDVSYLAPFLLSGLREVLEGDTVANSNGGAETPSGKKCANRDRKNIDPDSDGMSHTPSSEYGNCLVCFTCPCPGCSSAVNSNAKRQNDRTCHANLVLLHPIGPLQNVMAASMLMTPYGTNIGALPKTLRNCQYTGLTIHGPRRVRVMNELDVGDSIRQILQCGNKRSSIFLVRTSLHVTVVSVVPREELLLEKEYKGFRKQKMYTPSRFKQKNPQSVKGICWGTFRLTELQRLDLRSFARNSPSFTPASVTSHPSFNGSMMTNYQYKFAILSQSQNGQKERNIIHHFLWSPHSCDSNGSKRNKPASPRKHHITKHVILNLKTISEIAFMPRHPMVLWAVATAWVRPALTRDRAQRTRAFQSRLGGGSALYTVDLRTNEATYQWSQSVEENLVEGVHSINGLSVVWNDSEQKNHVWISSISAGKMWELDGKLYPVRVINTWSLPSQCETFSPTLPYHYGLYGAGTLFAQPSTFAEGDALDGPDPGVELPMLGISRTPGTNGIQLYQRPVVGPRFQLDSIECVSNPALSSWLGKKHGLSLSSILEMPKMERDIFACGLAAVKMPMSSFLTPEDCAEAGLASQAYSASLLVTLVVLSSGDIYAHHLLGSKGEIPGLRTCKLTSPGPDMEAKLSGGLNLSLSLTGPSASTTNFTTENSPEDDELVRPFRYSDVRCIASRQRREEPSLANEPFSIRPSNTAHDIVILQNGNAENKGPSVPLESCVSIPSAATSSLAESKQQDLLSTTESLQCDKLARVEERGLNREKARSDLSCEMIEFASAEW